MIVVKIGGSIAERCDPLLDELADRDDVVLVHGFGPQTDQVAREMGIEQRFVTSPTGVRSRLTDPPLLEALETAADRVGTRLTEALEARGCPVDHLGPGVPLLWGQAKPVLRDTTEDGRTVLVRGNRSGRVEDAQAAPVVDAVRRGYLPVVSPLAMDTQGPLSVDADRAAAALAAELEADALVLLTDVPGLLEDPGDPTRVVDRLAADRIDDLIGQAVTGGMVRKLVACREALAAGVGRAVIGSGLQPDPVARALAGDATEVIG